MDSVNDSVRKVFNFEMPERMPVAEWCMWWTRHAKRGKSRVCLAAWTIPRYTIIFGRDKNAQFW
jgi:hypothetical protein